MDASKTSATETKHKVRSPFPENGNTCRDSKSHVSTEVAGCSSWYDGRRDYAKKRERTSQDRESWASRERAIKSQDSFVEKDNKEIFKEEQQQHHSSQQYPAYMYGATADASYMNNNRAMMSLFPTYSHMATMNSQWAMNPLDGMSMASGMNVNTSTMNMTPSVDISTNSVATMNPFAYMGMASDPNMYGMMGMANYGQYGMMASESMMMSQVKEIIHLKLSSLYPPNPNAPPPSTRLKPPGCKTIFVGGLPENATEEVMKEIFQSVGEIATIRMSKKNFCHIRFNVEVVVDSAICYSGYRIKVGNKDDASNTGRLHVDYAQARDDQFEYECRLRALQREARHRERYEQEYFHPPTPPPVAHYSDHEASILGEKLRNEESFQQATFVLITWLDRGECNKRNSGYFYSMIQSTNSHVRRLMNEKQKYEEELNKAKMMLKQQMRGILLQFHEIDKVFNAASLQKVWDHFTKAQRKNIEIWKKQTAEIKDAHIEEVLNDRVEEEMDLSDGEGENEAKKTEEQSSNQEQTLPSKTMPVEEIEKLKEDNDSLRCQLLASQNEMSVISMEMKQEREFKQYELQSLRDSFGNCYRDLLKKRMRDAAELKELRPSKIKRTEGGSKDMGESSQDHEEESHKDIPELDVQLECFNFASTLLPTSSHLISITGGEARLIGLISTFLNVHPFGASVDYISSFLHKIDCTFNARDLEALMKKFPSVFKEESTGIGASLEKKWTFCGFKPQI